MSNLNNYVRLKGNVGKDPEVKYNGNGTVVADFSMATTESWKDRNGEWKDKTTWHNINCWGDLAKKVEALITKGQRIEIEGKLANDSWEDKEGKKHYKTYVAMQCFEILVSQPKSVSSDDLSRI
jgi:single-strand DNA-binding protein